MLHSFILIFLSNYRNALIKKLSSIISSLGELFFDVTSKNRFLLLMCTNDQFKNTQWGYCVQFVQNMCTHFVHYYSLFYNILRVVEFITFFSVEIVKYMFLTYITYKFQEPCNFTNLEYVHISFIKDIHTLMLLSRDPDAKKGPWCEPVLLSVPAASLIACDEFSPAQAIHSTVWSWSRNSTWKIDCFDFDVFFYFISIFDTLHSFVLMFHTRIEWSFEHDANMVPSGWTRTIRTHSRCPMYDFTQYLQKDNIWL